MSVFFTCLAKHKALVWMLGELKGLLAALFIEFFPGLNASQIESDSLINLIIAFGWGDHFDGLAIQGSVNEAQWFIMFQISTI